MTLCRPIPCRGSSCCEHRSRWYNLIQLSCPSCEYELCPAGRHYYCPLSITLVSLSYCLHTCQPLSSSALMPWCSPSSSKRVSWILKQVRNTLPSHRKVESDWYLMLFSVIGHWKSSIKLLTYFLIYVLFVFFWESCLLWTSQAFLTIYQSNLQLEVVLIKNYIYIYIYINFIQHCMSVVSEAQVCIVTHDEFLSFLIFVAKTLYWINLTHNKKH